jgi:hypothetical protein
MCNLYGITTNQAAIIALFRVINRYDVGNLPPPFKGLARRPPLVSNRCPIYGPYSGSDGASDHLPVAVAQTFALMAVPVACPSRLVGTPAQAIREIVLTSPLLRFCR